MLIKQGEIGESELAGAALCGVGRCVWWVVLQTCVARELQLVQNDRKMDFALQ